MLVGDGPFGIMPPSRENDGEAERSAPVGLGLERPVRETQERTERRRPRTPAARTGVWWHERGPRSRAHGRVRPHVPPGASRGLHWPPASPPPLDPSSETPPFIELSSSSRRRTSVAAPVSSALARSRRSSSPV